LLGIQCSLASSRMRILSAVVAGVAAVVAYSLPLKLNIVVAIAAAVAFCLILEAHGPGGRSGPGGPHPTPEPPRV